jgi:hypothetical protein
MIPVRLDYRIASDCNFDSLFVLIE